MRSWSFLKQKYGVYDFLQKAIEFQSIKKISINLIINYCIVLIGIIEKPAMKRERTFMARTRITLPPASAFDPCDVCVRNTLRGRGLGLKIWQYLFFSERGIASKPLLIPFQSSCSLD